MLELLKASKGKKIILELTNGRILNGTVISIRPGIRKQITLAVNYTIKFIAIVKDPPGSFLY